MDDRTLAALKASIEKWERMVAGEPEGSCPLCETFALGRGLNQCVGCPVAERVGQIGCYNTPYYDVPELSEGERKDPAKYAEYIAAAEVELDFLRSLLPEEHRERREESQEREAAPSANARGTP